MDEQEYTVILFHVKTGKKLPETKENIIKRLTTSVNTQECIFVEGSKESTFDKYFNFSIRTKTQQQAYTYWKWPNVTKTMLGEYIKKESKGICNIDDDDDYQYQQVCSYFLFDILDDIQNMMCILPDVQTGGSLFGRCFGKQNEVHPSRLPNSERRLPILVNNWAIDAVAPGAVATDEPLLVYDIRLYIIVKHILYSINNMFKNWEILTILQQNSTKGEAMQRQLSCIYKQIGPELINLAKLKNLAEASPSDLEIIFQEIFGFSYSSTSNALRLSYEFTKAAKEVLKPANIKDVVCNMFTTILRPLVQFYQSTSFDCIVPLVTNIEFSKGTDKYNIQVIVSGYDIFLVMNYESCRALFNKESLQATPRSDIESQVKQLYMEAYGLEDRDNPANNDINWRNWLSQNDNKATYEATVHARWQTLRSEYGDLPERYMENSAFQTACVDLKDKIKKKLDLSTPNGIFSVFPDHPRIRGSREESTREAPYEWKWNKYDLDVLVSFELRRVLFTTANIEEFVKGLWANLLSKVLTPDLGEITLKVDSDYGYLQNSILRFLNDTNRFMKGLLYNTILLNDPLKIAFTRKNRLAKWDKFLSELREHDNPSVLRTTPGILRHSFNDVSNARITLHRAIESFDTVFKKLINDVISKTLRLSPDEITFLASDLDGYLRVIEGEFEELRRILGLNFTFFVQQKPQNIRKLTKIISIARQSDGKLIIDSSFNTYIDEWLEYIDDKAIFKTEYSLDDLGTVSKTLSLLNTLVNSRVNAARRQTQNATSAKEAASFALRTSTSIFAASTRMRPDQSTPERASALALRATANAAALATAEKQLEKVQQNAKLVQAQATFSAIPARDKVSVEARVMLMCIEQKNYLISALDNVSNLLKHAERNLKAYIASIPLTPVPPTSTGGKVTYVKYKGRRYKVRGSGRKTYIETSSEGKVSLKKVEAYAAKKTKKSIK